MARRIRRTPPAPAAPKYERVRETLRRRILGGDYAPGTRLPSETELPAQLRVSNITVRRALRDLEHEGLIVRRKGSGTFVADRSRPAILPGRSLRIGVLWDTEIRPEGLFSGFSGEITRGMLETLGVAGVEPAWPRHDVREATRAVFRSRDGGMTVECMGEAPQGYVRHPPFKAVAEGGFDALMTVAVIESEFLSRVLDLGLASVLVDQLDERYSMRADQVYVDPLPGYRAAVQHFAAQGLKCIHFAVGYRVVAAPREEMTREEWNDWRGDRMRVDPDSFLRLSAYRQAMTECNLPVQESWVHYSNPAQERPERFAERLTELSPADRPEALLCHSYAQGQNTIEVFAARGLKLAAAGAAIQPVDGEALAIRCDAADLGATAAELLVSRLQRPNRRALRVGVPLEFNSAPNTRRKPAIVNVAAQS